MRFIVALLLMIAPAMAHENKPHWEHLDAATREWMRTLMRPDVPTMSCCGEADHYWCDKYFAKDGKAYCEITDTRDDKQFGRPHVPPGTIIEIPPEKLKYDRGNPTGHNIVFLSSAGFVWCFVQSTGI